MTELTSTMSDNNDVASHSNGKSLSMISLYRRLQALHRDTRISYPSAAGKSPHLSPVFYRADIGIAVCELIMEQTADSTARSRSASRAIVLVACLQVAAELFFPRPDGQPDVAAVIDCIGVGCAIVWLSEHTNLLSSASCTERRLWLSVVSPVARLALDISTVQMPSMLAAFAAAADRATTAVIEDVLASTTHNNPFAELASVMVQAVQQSRRDATDDSQIEMVCSKCALLATYRHAGRAGGHETDMTALASEVVATLLWAGNTLSQQEEALALESLASCVKLYTHHPGSTHGTHGGNDRVCRWTLSVVRLLCCSQCPSWEDVRGASACSSVRMATAVWNAVEHSNIAAVCSSSMDSSTPTKISEEAVCVFWEHVFNFSACMWSTPDGNGNSTDDWTWQQACSSVMKMAASQLVTSALRLTAGEAEQRVTGLFGASQQRLLQLVHTAVSSSPTLGNQDASGSYPTEVCREMIAFEALATVVLGQQTKLRANGISIPAALSAIHKWKRTISDYADAMSITVPSQCDSMISGSKSHHHVTVRALQKDLLVESVLQWKAPMATITAGDKVFAQLWSSMRSDEAIHRLIVEKLIGGSAGARRTLTWLEAATTVDILVCGWLHATVDLPHLQVLRHMIEVENRRQAPVHCIPTASEIADSFAAAGVVGVSAAHVHLFLDGGVARLWDLISGSLQRQNVPQWFRPSLVGLRKAEAQSAEAAVASALKQPRARVPKGTEQTSSCAKLALLRAEAFLMRTAKRAPQGSGVFIAVSHGNTQSSAASAAPFRALAADFVQYIKATGGAAVSSADDAILAALRCAGSATDPAVHQQLVDIAAQELLAAARSLIAKGFLVKKTATVQQVASSDASQDTDELLYVPA